MKFRHSKASLGVLLQGCQIDNSLLYTRIESYGKVTSNKPLGKRTRSQSFKWISLEILLYCLGVGQSRVGLSRHSFYERIQTR